MYKNQTINTNTAIIFLLAFNRKAKLAAVGMINNDDKTIWPLKENG